jgi:zinc protease
MLHLGNLAITVFMATAVAKPVVALDPVVHSFALENGLEVWVCVDAKAPLVATALRLEMGTADEAGGQIAPPGVAHLIEHLMFRGSPHAPDGSYDRWLEAAGGESNAWTDHDATVYTTLVPSNALELVLALEAERLGHRLASLDARALRAEVQVVLAERAEKMDLEGGDDQMAWHAAVFPDHHPYHWPVLGTVAEVERLSTKDVARFVQGRMVPNRSRLIIVGDVELAQVERWVQKWFGDLPAESALDQPTVSVRKAQGADWVRVGGPHQLTLLWPTVSRLDAAAPALDLAASLLARPGRGWLVRALMGVDSSVERVHAWHWAGELGGYFGLTVEVGEGDLGPVKSRIQDELSRVLDMGSADRFIEAARLRWRTDKIRALEDPERRAMALAECAADEGPGCLAARSQRLDALDSADVRDVIERFLVGAPPVTVSTVSLPNLGQAVDGASPLVIP